MTRIAAFTFNAFEENTYLVYNEKGECLIIDPGCSNSAEEEVLERYISENNLHPSRLINTHCHIDHILGNAFVSKKWGLLPEAHPKEGPVLASGVALARAYGIPYEPSPSIDGYLKEGDQITLGDTSLEVIFLPGHSPGHIALYHRDEGWIISGDVLFKGSIGRYDLPGSNFHDLRHSIMDKLMLLPNDVKVYPGHGPATTIGEERKGNPFIQEFKQLN